MANWEKLNKEFDEALDSMTKEDWKSWYERFKQKQINQNKMTAVEFLKSQYNFNKQLFPSDFEQAKEMEDKKLQENWEECEIRMKQSIYWNNKEMQKEQIGYSEEDVREMLFMALYEPQEECCTTHTKYSIVRKVLKTFNQLRLAEQLENEIDNL